MYRVEIYLGKLDSDQRDMQEGPNAVLRNIDKVICGATKHLIVTDRFLHERAALIDSAPAPALLRRDHLP